ncbi:MAG: hypothetical protein U5L04_09070 [Trueperaceae bacterium]|nr:hypothetical protein [Trueperaceae bacterium]
MRQILMVFTLLAGVAFASHYTGAYYLEDVTLTLQHDASGYLYGELTDGTDSYVVEGEAYGTTPGQGYIYSDTEAYVFESLLTANDAVLTLTVVELDAQGQPLWPTARELTLSRGTSRRGAAPDNGTGVFARPETTAPETTVPETTVPETTTPEVENPLATPGAGNNPLTAAAPVDDRFAGTFAGEGLQVVLEPTPSGYSGQILFGDQSFTLSARAVGDTLSGTFNSGSGAFAFTATLGDGVMTFQTGDARYTLRPEAATPDTPRDETPKDQQKLPASP